LSGGFLFCLPAGRQVYSVSMEVKIEESWKRALQEEFGKPYFEQLTQFVKDEYKKGTVYPPPKNIFRAFELTPFDTVEVVLLGQDPYHGAGQANGLSFAVGEGVRLPPSLQNIFKEINDDLGESQQGETLLKKSGDLSRWAVQGVLLLNATLTVRGGAAGSHQGKGWEALTDAAIKALSDQRENIVFILWGNYARTKGAHIDRKKHLVLESPHPSPFSAYNGFFGSKPFSRTNAYLEKHSKKPIDWR
jgi:uracil-DNA glycosylase